jgi:hypothetical protein
MGDLTSLVLVLLQPGLDVLGMINYETELVLCGIFAWVRKKMRQRRSRDATTNEESDNRHDHTAARSITVHDGPSSTSIFRTPSADMANTRARTNRISSSVGVRAES